MDCVIVSGGNSDAGLIEKVIKEKTAPDILESKSVPGDSSFIIAADRGLETLMRLGIVPDFIIGDFDSADGETFSFAKKMAEENKAVLEKLLPEKDDTDTEAALTKALDAGMDKITILGATGTRIDHVIANILILKKALDRGKEALILDRNNRIRLLGQGSCKLKKENQYGKYISFYPLGGSSTVSLSGFKYNLDHVTLLPDTSLGTSNEIVEEIATICVHNGTLIMIESKD